MDARTSLLPAVVDGPETAPSPTSATSAPDTAPREEPEWADGRPVVALTALVLVGVNAFWYLLKLHHGYTWLQPLFMVGGTALFFVLLRVFTGRGFRDISPEGRFVVVSAIALFGLLWLFGRVGTFQRNIAGLVPESGFTPLYGFFYFSFNCVLARTLIPLVFIRWPLRRRAADFGYRFRGTFELWWVYLLLATLVGLAVVFYASRVPAFLAKYPMCRAMIDGGQIQLGHFLLYQMAYGAIFISGESFWRGYIIFGLERDIGRLGLAFMIIPYVMAHYGKPFQETMGAIVTGLVLGYLALRHRSFWLGVAAHWGVALTMDISAIVRRGISLTW